MKTIVENFEMRKNVFSRVVAGVLCILGVLTFFISLTEHSKNTWLMGGAALLLAGIWYVAIKHKLVISASGMVVKDVFKEREISWNEIRSIDYHSSYHGHGVQLVLTISYGAPSKKIQLHPKQYNREKMMRLFEILHQQCKDALKNPHFIKAAEGKMTWREQLKMF